jgi:hypothetical protein
VLRFDLSAGRGKYFGKEELRLEEKAPMESVYNQNRQALQCVLAPKYRLVLATFGKQRRGSESFIAHAHSPSVML